MFVDNVFRQYFLDFPPLYTLNKFWACEASRATWVDKTHKAYNTLNKYKMLLKILFIIWQLT